MKAVLISIRPKWCELIASGKKTIEVRKTRPKIETPFKCYIYCTLDGGLKGDILLKDGQVSKVVCGMVIGEFVCDGFDEFTPTEYGVSFKSFSALHRTCLSVAEIREYLCGKIGYGWHISDLKIYEKPSELSELYHACDTGDKVLCENCDQRFNRFCNRRKYIKRPPQSWCYVEEEIEKRDVSLDYWLGADLDESIDMS